MLVVRPYDFHVRSCAENLTSCDITWLLILFRAMITARWSSSITQHGRTSVFQTCYRLHPANWQLQENFRWTGHHALQVKTSQLAQSFIKFVWAPYWAMYPSSTCNSSFPGLTAQALALQMLLVECNAMSTAVVQRYCCQLSSCFPVFILYLLM